MKKTLLALAFAMPAMAGTPTVTDPAPVPAAAPAEPACAIEVAGLYRWADRRMFTDEKKVDVYGVDLTAVHSFTPNHALTLRLGYTYGSETELWGPVSVRYQLESVSLMPGYRYTQPVTDDLSVFAGVNAGIAWSRLKESESMNDPMLGSFYDADSDHSWGFAASAEIGVSYKLCEDVAVFAAYELSGHTCKFTPWNEERSHRQLYQGVRAGVSIKF